MHKLLLTFFILFTSTAFASLDDGEMAGFSRWSFQQRSVCLRIVSQTITQRTTLSRYNAGQLSKAICNNRDFFNEFRQGRADRDPLLKRLKISRMVIRTPLRLLLRHVDANDRAQIESALRAVLYPWAWGTTVLEADPLWLPTSLDESSQNIVVLDLDQWLTRAAEPLSKFSLTDWLDVMSRGRTIPTLIVYANEPLNWYAEQTPADYGLFRSALHEILYIPSCETQLAQEPALKPE